ncbi:hypothetical protein QE152_g1617 [Popillia japonica]|uniref:Uncharacterized protein n=1 Tax=Popillia japonica TaxID=7064 RepID=A0AAW1N5L5_POPJA
MLYGVQFTHLPPPNIFPSLRSIASVVEDLAGEKLQPNPAPIDPKELSQGLLEAEHSIVWTKQSINVCPW